MIQLLPCPSCQQLTILPAGVSLEATIQCPHCDESFVVGEMLTSRFQSWIVVDNPAAPLGYSLRNDEQTAQDSPAGQAAMLAAQTGTAIAAGSHSNDELRLQSIEPPNRVAEKPKTDWSKFEPITHEQYERLRRNSRSPLWSVLQIALGGLAAIPISLLLIWHVIGTDVGNAGPLVGRYVPWIVPEKFRPFDNLSSNDPIDSTTRNTNPPPAGASGFRNFDDILAPRSDGGASQLSQPVDQVELGAAPEDGNPTGRDVPSTNTNASDKVPVPASNPITTPPTMDSLPPASPDMDAPTNVFALIEKTMADMESWTISEPDKSADLKEKAQLLYADLIQLATTLESLPQANPVLRVIREKMQPIGRAVKREPDVQEVLRQGASYWVGKQSSKREFPLAMIVEIREVTEVDQVWRIKVSPDSQLAFGNAPLQIEIPRVLAPSLIDGRRLLLLGVVKTTASANPNEPESAATAETSAPQTATFSANYLHTL